MRTITLLIAAAWLGIPAIAWAQGVDYHKAQQAGKVWEDKLDENNRQRARARQASVNSEGVAYRAPLTASDRDRFLAANRADYDRLLRSVGRKNADKWLEIRARQERAKR